MLKLCFKLFSFAAIVLVGLATAIKFIQGTSYKEAVGIMEELWKEMMKNCCGRKAESTAPEA